MFKFALEEIVFFLKDNRVHSAPIISRACVENSREEKAVTPEQKAFYCAFGEAGIRYHTVHGTYLESEIFASRKDLAKSLLVD